MSLTCPLGKMRMSTPCRASTCNHLQCFDAMTYLQMNERKPTWMCPVCDKSAIYDNLTIDGLVLRSVTLSFNILFLYISIIVCITFRYIYNLLLYNNLFSRNHFRTRKLVFITRIISSSLITKELFSI